MKNDTDKTKKEEEGEGVEEVVETKGEEGGEVMADSVKREEFDALKELTAQLENNLKRALADYDNLRKRGLVERNDWIKLANQELLLRILPVLDTLMLAGKHSKDASLQISLNQFLDILKAEGVVKIETVGRDFDPLLMEAIETVEGEEGKVVEEIRAGFLLHEKLLRAAQVKVGAKSKD